MPPLKIWSPADDSAVSGEPLLLAAWEAWEGAIDCGHTGQAWSADALRGQAVEIAERPAFRRLAPGEPVVLMLGNTAAFPVLLTALLRLGCNPFLVHAATPLPALRRIISQFGVRHVVHDFLDGLSALPRDAFADRDTAQIGPMPVSLLQTPDRTEAETTAPGQAVILHPTSGTYGAAKFCVRNQAAAVAEAENYLGAVTPYRRTRVTVTTPLTHAYAFGFGFVSALLSHSTLAVAPHFNPRRVVRLEHENPSGILAIVPPMAQSLTALAAGGGGFAPVVFYAGAPMNRQAGDAFAKAYGTKLFTILGTTETGAISTSYSEDGKLPGVGRPLKGVDIGVSDPDSYRDLGGGIGELTVTSTSMMQGYVPGLVPSGAITAFRTGDLGAIDNNGCIELVGRIRDIINLGGMKVDPAEVEAAVLSLAGVTDVAVYPGLYADGSEFIQAAIVGEVGAEAVRAHCARELEAHKVPVVVHVVDAIPRTPSGKCIKIECPDYPRVLLAGGARQ